MNKYALEYSKFIIIQLEKQRHRIGFCRRARQFPIMIGAGALSPRVLSPRRVIRIIKKLN